MNGLLDRAAAAQCSPLSDILLSHLRAIDAHYWPGIDGMTADIVLQLYFQAAVAGHVPGKVELLRLYPDLSAELETFFAAAPLPAVKAPEDSSSSAIIGGIRAD
jgi:hypothetical protein